jgi:DNA-binding MarR family transcriptional regulator
MSEKNLPDGAPAHDDGSEAWQLTDVITRLRRVLRSSVRRDYPWETLPMAQVEILQRLSEEPGLRVSELAQRHRLASNTVSALIQQMVLADLVTRVTAMDDRRAVVLRLTDLGKANLAGWRHANQERLTAALERLSEDERRSITKSLPALAELAGRLEQDEQASQTAAEA